MDYKCYRSVVTVAVSDCLMLGPRRALSVSFRGHICIVVSYKGQVSIRVFVYLLRRLVFSLRRTKALYEYDVSQ